MSRHPRMNPKLAKFTYPSIEYILATAHYPEEFRKEARTYPQFVRAPPVQLFHIAQGHIPIFVPMPGERVKQMAQPQKQKSQSPATSRIIRLRRTTPPAANATDKQNHHASAADSSIASLSSASDNLQTIALSPPPRQKDRPVHPLPRRRVDRPKPVLLD